MVAYDTTCCSCLLCVLLGRRGVYVCCGINTNTNYDEYRRVKSKGRHSPGKTIFDVLQQSSCVRVPPGPGWRVVLLLLSRLNCLNLAVHATAEPGTLFLLPGRLTFTGGGGGVMDDGALGCCWDSAWCWWRWGPAERGLDSRLSTRKGRKGESKERKLVDIHFDCWFFCSTPVTLSTARLSPLA